MFGLDIISLFLQEHFQKQRIENSMSSSAATPKQVIGAQSCSIFILVNFITCTVLIFQWHNCVSILIES